MHQIGGQRQPRLGLFRALGRTVRPRHAQLALALRVENQTGQLLAQLA